MPKYAPKGNIVIKFKSFINTVQGLMQESNHRNASKSKPQKLHIEKMECKIVLHFVTDYVNCLLYETVK